jgi:hypothetical protein
MEFALVALLFRVLTECSMYKRLLEVMPVVYFIKMTERKLRGS